MPTVLPFENGALDPPGPVVDAALLGVDGAAFACPLLLDTGANTTVVPLAVAVAAGFAPAAAETVRAAGFDGRADEYPELELTLVIFGRTVSGWFLLVDADRGFLGRDVLRFFRVRYDGPGETLTVED